VPNFVTTAAIEKRGVRCFSPDNDYSFNESLKGGKKKKEKGGGDFFIPRKRGKKGGKEGEGPWPWNRRRLLVRAS